MNIVQDTAGEVRALTRWGGIICVAIALGHTAIGLAMTWRYWPGWLFGDLWSGLGAGGMLASKLSFWSGPGGFVVPLTLLGLLAISRAREGRPMPGYVGVVLAAWAVVAGYVTFPSPFLLFVLPAVLFLLDTRRADGIG